MASVTSLDHDMRQLRLDRYTPQAANEVRSWIEDSLGEPLPAGDLLDALKDGVALCKLANLVLPSPGIKYKKNTMPFVQRENISLFLSACERPPMNMPAHDRFLTVDLYDNKDPAQVMQCLAAFSRTANLINPSRFVNVIGPKRTNIISPTRRTATGGIFSEGYASNRGESDKSQPSESIFGARSVTSRALSPALTGGSDSSRTPTTSARNSVGTVSSWSRKSDEGTTAPAWNIHQYGYMGGASQGNQGVSFGSRRQIIAPSVSVPSLAEKEQQRREREAEEERVRIDALEEQRRRRLEDEEAEEGSHIAEEERRQEEIYNARQKERQELERERQKWEEEERQWREEEQRRKVEEEKLTQNTSVSARPVVQDKSRRVTETERIKELERQLEAAQERERAYQLERAERAQRQETPQVEQSSHHEEILAGSLKDTLHGIDIPLEDKTIDQGLKEQQVEKKMIPMPTKATRLPSSVDTELFQTLPHPPKLETPSSPYLQNQQALPAPKTGPPSPLPRPLPDPSPYFSTATGGNRTDRYLANNPPPVAPKPNSYFPSEIGMTSTSERTAEDARRIGSQAKTKAGGWASKGLLEREMEKERERQKEWEEAQMQRAQGVARSGGLLGPRELKR